MEKWYLAATVKEKSTIKFSPTREAKVEVFVVEGFTVEVSLEEIGEGKGGQQGDPTTTEMSC